jgi:hypothetical protein
LEIDYHLKALASVVSAVSVPVNLKLLKPPIMIVFSSLASTPMAIACQVSDPQRSQRKFLLGPAKSDHVLPASKDCKRIQKSLESLINPGGNFNPPLIIA